MTFSRCDGWSLLLFLFFAFVCLSKQGERNPPYILIIVNAIYNLQSTICNPTRWAVLDSNQ